MDEASEGSPATDENMAPVDVYWPFFPYTPVGRVFLRWEQPAELTLVARHPAPICITVTDTSWFTSAYTESLFAVRLARRAGISPKPRVRHIRYNVYAPDPRLASRIKPSREEIGLMERVLTRWLESWIAEDGPECRLACALAHHNKYAALRESYDNGAVPPTRIVAHQREMVRCALRAAGAANWLTRTCRREVREWALQYVSLVGRPAHTVTLEDLALP